MRKHDVMLSKEERKKAIRTCWCMIGFAIDSIGATNGACVGGGLVGEVDMAMRSSVSEMGGRGARGQDEEEGLRAIGNAPNNLFGNIRRWWWLSGWRWWLSAGDEPW